MWHHVWFSFLKKARKTKTKTKKNPISNNNNNHNKEPGENSIFYASLWWDTRVTCLFVARRGEEEEKCLTKHCQRIGKKEKRKSMEKINVSSLTRCAVSKFSSKSLSPKPIFIYGFSGVERECDLFGKREIHFFLTKKKKNGEKVMQFPFYFLLFKSPRNGRIFRHKWRGKSFLVFHQNTDTFDIVPQRILYTYI